MKRVPGKLGKQRPDMPRRVRTAGAPPMARQRSAEESPSRLPAGSADDRVVQAAFARLRATAAALTAAAHTARDAAMSGFSVAERDAARHTHREIATAEAEVSEAADAAADLLAGRAERLAPGPAAAAWDAPEWRSADWLNSGDARFIRLGTVVGFTPDPPALVPLLDSGNIAIVGDPAPLPGIVLRALAAMPAGRLEFVVFDPRLRGAFSAFAGLRRSAAQILAEPLATAPEFATRLHEVRSGVSRVAELLGAHGVASLGDLGGAPDPHRLVVVLDYPSGVDPVVQEELLRLAHGGPSRGVSLLVHHDPAAPSLHGVGAQDLLDRCCIVRDGRVDVLGAAVRLDPPPPRDLVTSVVAQVAERAHRGAAPSVAFADLLPRSTWQRSSVEGLTATLGTAGLERVDLELRGADPALPNALIGGASGQGKSNLLLVLLHGIAAAYSPDEVEMYLLDYKEGLEFDRLGPRGDRPHWMPHVRVLGLEGDRSFGLATLRHLDAEFRRRADIFREAGAQHIGAYRAARPDARMPRLLLVIDEFQVLLGEDDELTREAVQILETLARRGRAVGVHLVLASQTLSGIEALATKERSIFGQFPWRISLKTEASESEAVLGRGNTEAAQLRYRGEAIINREYGAAEHNRRATIAYADEQLLDRLRAQWFGRWLAPEPPRVFYASRASDPRGLPAALARVLAGEHEDGVRPALLGLPVDVDPHPVAFGLRPDPGRVLAVIGDGREAAFGALGAAVWSIAAQELPGNAEFYFLDALAKPGLPAPELRRLARAVRERGHTVHERADVGAALVELAAHAEDTPRYVIAPGLHRVAHLDDYGPGAMKPGEALQQLVAEGPVAQTYLLAWWSSLAVFHSQLRYEVSSLVSGYLFLRAPESDVQQVAGPFVRYSAQPYRALFLDRAQGAIPQLTVPFGALDE